MTLTLRSSRFRAEREADWKRLERLLARMETKAPRQVAEDDLLALPVLYRSALSSLSMARAISLDQALIVYLESLCARAYFLVYGARASFFERLGGFFVRSWPRAIRDLWPETLLSLVISVLATVAGYWLVTRDPAWFYTLIPDAMTDGRDPSASTASLAETLRGQKDDGLSVFATFLFTHNAQVAIMAFATGFAFGLPTLLLLGQNGLSLGAFLALFAGRDLGLEAGGWLMVHGTTELFAVILAGAAGLRLGRAAAMPGHRSRMDALGEAGRTAGAAMGGVVVMLIAAGALEGFARQLVEPTLARYAIGGAMLALWLLYFYFPRRRAP
jgi:uncharacterized membrane protein SpoIIM required for sporulation